MQDGPTRVKLSRRRFIAAGFGAAAAMLPWRLQAAAPRTQLLSPARLRDHYVLASLAGELQADLDTMLPFRGHGLQLYPHDDRLALVIARRPGTVAIQVDLSSGEIIQTWRSEENRHFYGHACFSRDGKTVFTTENDIDTGEGIVSVRDTRNFQVIDEYPSYGIGPHELLMMPDGVTLAVANGGIMTFPETGRVKLNRGRIVSSLAYIDSRDGKLLGSYPVPLPQLSLRHLAVAPDGQIAGAMQYEGERGSDGQALLLFHRGESALQMASAPQQDWNRMANYAASIAYDAPNACFAITCPLGDTVAAWKADRSYQGHIVLAKASGIVFESGNGYVSNELGQVYRLDTASLQATLYAEHPGLQWDNHLYLRRGKDRA